MFCIVPKKCNYKVHNIYNWSYLRLSAVVYHDMSVYIMEQCVCMLICLLFKPSDHSYEQQRKTKKNVCNAAIHLRELITFPQYKVRPSS